MRGDWPRVLWHVARQVVRAAPQSVPAVLSSHAAGYSPLLSRGAASSRGRNFTGAVARRIPGNEPLFSRVHQPAYHAVGRRGLVNRSACAVRFSGGTVFALLSQSRLAADEEPSAMAGN